MRLNGIALRLLARAPAWFVGVVAVVFLAVLIWIQATNRAEQRAELDQMRRDRTVQQEASEQAEELRDEFRKIEESSAVGGDDAVLERLREGDFGRIPGAAPAGD